MRHGSHSPLSYKLLQRDHRFVTTLFIVMGALVFGSVIFCALGLIVPVG